MLLGALEECVKGRVWDGKEEVLGAVAALAVAGKARLREAEGMAVRVAGLLFGECAKKKKEYRVGALKAAKAFAGEFKTEVKGAAGLMESVADLFDDKEGSPAKVTLRPRENSSPTRDMSWN